VNLRRQQIIYYSLQYQGDYRKVLRAIHHQEDYQPIDNIKAVTFLDSQYPACFWQLKYPPLCLYYKGDVELLNHAMIGIVGSRKADSEFLQQTKTIVKNLKSDYYIVSGMAKGIDGCSFPTVHTRGAEHSIRLSSHYYPCRVC
jgi:DNA processing protein